ncbi:MAG: hypothetical protein KAW85_03500 [Candidatus Aminicenantes bacterium]|nr:hypothetical protein [Candidatus Aminicenantes bacterium]
MKVFKQANLVRIVILAAIAVLVCPNAILAKPGLDNPSFEDGELYEIEELTFRTLSGWNAYVSGLGDLSDWDAYVSGFGWINARMSFKSYEKKGYTSSDIYFYPKDGTYFAWLMVPYGAGSYTTLSQTFYASADSKISGWAFFDTWDFPRTFPEYSDNAYVQIKSGDKVLETVFSKSVSDVDVGAYGWTPWTKWEYTFEEEGTYTIEARVANSGFSWGSPSFMGLDGVVLTVQEPKEMKQDIINQLGMYAHESKRISKAIREIEKSLEDKLWADDFHLKLKGGKKVLDHERHAARELDHLLKGIPDDGKCGGISFIELKYTGKYTGFDQIDVDVYLKNVPLRSFHVKKGDTFVVEATGETGGKLHPEIKLVSNGIELAKIHTSCSKPINEGDEHYDFIIVDLVKLPPKNGKKGKKHQISDDAQVAVEKAIEQLVTVDRLLAEIQLKAALQLTPVDDPARQDKFDRKIAKAEKELAKGDEDRDDYKLGKAIQHYKKVWEHATHAIKEATKLPKS